MIQITVGLGVNMMNTEFSGRPEEAEESARHSFHRGGSMREILTAAGDMQCPTHVTNTMDHHASHGLR